LSCCTRFLEHCTLLKALVYQAITVVKGKAFASDGNFREVMSILTVAQNDAKWELIKTF